MPRCKSNSMPVETDDFNLSPKNLFIQFFFFTIGFALLLPSPLSYKQKLHLLYVFLLLFPLLLPSRHIVLHILSLIIQSGKFFSLKNSSLFHAIFFIAYTLKNITTNAHAKRKTKQKTPLFPTHRAYKI